MQAGGIHLEMGCFMGARGCSCPKEAFRAKIGAGRGHSSGNGTFVDAKGCLCPKEVFRAKIGAGRGHSSGNGTFHGIKGFFMPKKGVSCQKRCRQGSFVRKWDVSWGKGGFCAQKGCFVPEKVWAERIHPEM